MTRRRIAELEAALERARGASEVLRRIGTAVATKNLEELLGDIVDATVELLLADRATLYLRDGDRLIAHGRIGREFEAIALSIGHDIAGHVAKTGKPVRIADAHRDARFDPSWDKKSGHRTRSIVAMPIVSDDGTVIGVLQALNKLDAEGEVKPFTRYDLDLLRALAAQAAVSIDKARLFDKMRATTERLARTLEHLELLYQLETAMSGADTVGELAGRVVARVGAACGAQAGALLHRSQTGELVLYAVDATSDEELRQVIVKPDDGAAVQAMSEGRIVSLGPDQVRESRRVRELLGVRVRSALAAPLGSDDRIQGALVFFNRRDADAFSSDDAALLKLVSANVSTELRVIDARQMRERSGRLESIGRLLSGVMHDLRTPLAVISGYLQLMEVSADPTERSGYGKIVAEQFDLIAGMQRDMLAYARGERQVLVRKIELPQFFREIVAQFEADAEMLGVEVALDVPSRAAWFDEGKMARVMHNLIRNALEAMQSSGGELRISSRIVHEGLEVSVTDSGGGIPAAIRNRLFEPFVTAGKRHGTGLGLANVKKIVEEHEGSVQVRSSPRGTCFTVTLPRALEAPLARTT